MEEIKQFNEGNNGYFISYVNGEPSGKMTYKLAGDKGIIIDHTEVNKAYEGQGIGKKLLMKAVEYARENDKKITPLCSFAKVMFERMEEIKDVLYPPK